MQTVESHARYIASTVALEILDINVFDDDFMQDLPRDIISRITGKRFKKLYRDCPQKKLAAFQQSLSSVKVDTALTLTFEHNLQLLVNKLELPVQCKAVLKLCAVTTINEGLYALFDEHLRHWVSDVDIIIAEALNLKVDELSYAVQLISNTSLFEQSDRSIFGLLLMPYVLAKNLMSHKAKSYHDLLNGLYYQLQPTSLTLNDYPHIESQFVSQFLNQAVKHKTTGVNILLYGSAGTGKTSFSQALSRYTKSNLIAVKAVGENLFHGVDEISSERNIAHLRLQHYRLMQKLFTQNESSCLLLDEVEDIFSEYTNGLKVSKDRLHATLETNALPCIWITNHIDCLPESVIRRFSYVLHIGVPPKHIKAQILAKPLKGLRLSQGYKNGLANLPDLTPAHVVNASNVARALNLTGKDAEQCLDHHIEECLSACGRQISITCYQPEMDFNPNFINLAGTHSTVEQVINTVSQFNGSRSLLLGSAGTGKSAFVHYIAEQTEHALMIIKPSDVLSKYVGEAEQNIARLFRQAKNEDSIIFLDEVDSVLTSRETLSQQHERQLVNQILIELDQCEQTVFAATNFSGNLDTALLRRFDFKLTFQYLSAKQSIALYGDLFGKPPAEINHGLKQLSYLSLGDFAIAARRNRMSKKPLTDKRNLEILIQENNRKKPNQPIGFIK
ncbi:AAA family ATPase [Shewanella olleyana]|uniref:AAA family ATPase n=1 Tax=Shewanella olleyana TaxID=135626 RepID=UPI00200F91AC|nr:AAA family ATPase [Shewanella olleyana]MCL1067454.1 AAA family ATPase [Shewanella olleyana]